MLLLALDAFEQTLCPGCKQEQHLAWQTSGWWLLAEHECGACTALAKAQAEREGADMSKWKPPVYRLPYLDPKNTIGDLPPLQLFGGDRIPDDD